MRGDIQALRAVAVILVVLFHLDLPYVKGTARVAPFLCTGGFAGVDIFFVISGYLVVGSMLKESMASPNGMINFTQFLSRRIKRLLFPSR
jgi:peptidoglycan/LPS O-acetylase OafA/YrhL